MDLCYVSTHPTPPLNSRELSTWRWDRPQTAWIPCWNRRKRPSANFLHARPISALAVEKREAGGAGAHAPQGGQLGLAPQSDFYLLMESREERHQRAHSRKDWSSEGGTLGEEGPCRCARLVSPYSSIPNPKYRLLQMGDESPVSPESMTDHQHIGYGAETESSQNFLSAMCLAWCQLLHFHLTPLNPQNNLAGQVGLSLFSYRWRNRGRREDK